MGGRVDEEVFQLGDVALVAEGDYADRGAALLGDPEGPVDQALRRHCELVATGGHEGGVIAPGGLGAQGQIGERLGLAGLGPSDRQAIHLRSPCLPAVRQMLDRQPAKPRF
jgi:hypothetical protein